MSGALAVQRDPAVPGLVVLVLQAPPGNVIDLEMLERLREEVARAAAEPAVKALLLAGAGGEFSFGASIAEHRRGTIEHYLPAFHGLFRELAESGLVVLAAVRGRCLGGGLELAAFAHRLVLHPGATLGCPEIKIGAIAPVASILLPARVGQPRADELLLTGRSLRADEALAIGLADGVDPEPEAALRSWFAASLGALSASSLRHAVRAARAGLHERLARDLPRLEAVYLRELSPSHDAEEGIEAFLEKRAPRWRTHADGEGGATRDR